MRATGCFGHFVKLSVSGDVRSRDRVRTRDPNRQQAAIDGRRPCITMRKQVVDYYYFRRRWRPQVSLVTTDARAMQHHRYGARITQEPHTASTISKTELQTLDDDGVSRRVDNRARRTREPVMRPRAAPSRLPLQLCLCLSQRRSLPASHQATRYVTH
jgi:hypothetical protein